MDPLSIVASVGTLSARIYICVSALYAFSKSTAVIDQTVKGLYDETCALQRVIASIGGVLQGPSVKSDDKLPLWKDVASYLQECDSTVQTMQKRLDSMHLLSKAGRTSTVGKHARDVWTQLKLNWREDEVKELRDHIHSHCLALQITLQTINVYLSSTAPDIVLDELCPRLEKLLTLIEDTHRNTLPVDTGDDSLDRKHARLRESAKQVVSHASVVIDTHASNWDGSQLDERTRIFSMASSTTGSEFGEPLKAEAKARISAWMRRDTFAPLESLEEENSRTSRIGSNESGATEVTSTSATLTANDEFESDEEELEIEMTQKILALGRQKLEHGKYPQAEAMLRRALQKTQRLGTKATSLNVKGITLDIANVCYEQDKLDDAQHICEGLINALPTSDADRVRLFKASDLLAQVHLRKGAFALAIRQCKQTIKGRRRLDSANPAYYDSLALLAAIHEANEDEIEGLAYASLLPEGYQRPAFKRPAPIEVLSPPTAALPDAAAAAFRATPDPPLTEEALRITASLRLVDEALDTDVDTMSMSPPEPAFVPAVRSETLAADMSTTADSQDDGSMDIPEEGLRPSLTHAFTVSTVPSAQQSPAPPPVTKCQPGPVQSARRTASEPVLDSRSRSLRLSSSEALGKPTALTSEQEVEALHLLKANGYDSVSTYVDASKALFWAVRKGHDVVVQMLLQRGIPGKRTFGIGARKILSVSTAESPSNKRTPLQAAAWAGHLSTCRPLLQFGASVMAKDLARRTPLHLAAAKGYSAILQLMLETGVENVDPASASIYTGFPYTPLMEAAMNGHAACVHLLLDAHANPNVMDGAYTLLHWAVDRDLLDVLDRLLERGADIIAYRNGDETKQLRICAKKGKREAATRLIALGADVSERDDFGHTLLHTAAYNGQTDFATMLLDMDSPLAIDDSMRGGFTALGIAALEGHTSMVELLVSRGADVNACTTDGKKILHYVLNARRVKDRNVAVLLASAGAEYCSCGDCRKSWANMNSLPNPKY